MAENPARAELCRQAELRTFVSEPPANLGSETGLPIAPVMPQPDLGERREPAVVIEGDCMRALEQEAQPGRVRFDRGKVGRLVGVDAKKQGVALERNRVAVGVGGRNELPARAGGPDAHRDVGLNRLLVQRRKLHRTRADARCGPDRETLVHVHGQIRNNPGK